MTGAPTLIMLRELAESMPHAMGYCVKILRLRFTPRRMTGWVVGSCSCSAVAVAQQVELCCLARPHRLHPPIISLQLRQSDRLKIRMCFFAAAQFAFLRHMRRFATSAYYAQPNVKAGSMRSGA